MSSPSKPEFILVPGAWHGPESFAPTTTLLEKAGYVVHGITLAAGNGAPRTSPPLSPNPSTSIQIPTSNRNPDIQTIQPDVDLIRATLEKVLSTGKNVVMLYHSYGSVPGTEALAPYLSAPKPGYGKVLRLVFCTAFVLPEGGSLIAALNNEPLPWFKITKGGELGKSGVLMRCDVKDDLVEPTTPQQIFYNDLSSTAAAPYISALKPHSYRTFFSQLTVAPWKTIPSTYIICTQDNAIPLPAQEGMLAMAGQMAPGSFDVVERVEAGHSAFISRPEVVVGILVGAAGGE
ncbi:hypothetical protein LSUE1_G005114 [Lachnellula suecica]|uniref:AB hydrolase-1 domain-containing protein n=1 Tax=Lachnellula suecica TaxID=602035 RepID=A0A8T9C1F0_9HELO|nr:hypothetical protein LSUE1_G005114 [Lachnellula suecica]